MSGGRGKVRVMNGEWIPFFFGLCVFIFSYLAEFLSIRGKCYLELSFEFGSLSYYDYLGGLVRL